MPAAVSLAKSVRVRRRAGRGCDPNEAIGGNR